MTRNVDDHAGAARADLHEIESKGMQTTEAQRAAAARWVTGFAKRWSPIDPEALRDLMHSDTRNLIPPMTSPVDADGVVAHFKQVAAQVPGLRLAVTRWATAGDAVFVEWLATAQLGGRTLEWRGIDRVLLRGDRTYAGEAFWDTRRVAELVAEIQRAGSGGDVP